MENKISVSGSSIILTETEQEFCKEFIGDFFSRYLEQINDDIRIQNQLLKHRESCRSEKFIEEIELKIKQSRAERTKTVLAIEFLKSVGAI